VLVRLKILSLEWVDETMGASVVGYWRLWHLVAEDARKLAQNRKYWESRARKIWNRRGGVV
jgi:hypothetical protein